MRRALTGLGIVAGIFFLWLFAVWPPPVWYRTHWPRETAFMTRPHTAPLSATARARGRLYRPVPLDSITADLQDAVMIGEDNNFLISARRSTGVTHASAVSCWRSCRTHGASAIGCGAPAPSPSSWRRTSTSHPLETHCAS
jgi:hypothetical protein